MVLWLLVAQSVTFLHLNDTHHHLFADPQTAGYARLAWILDSLAAGVPNPVRVHAGDVSVGDLSFNADSIPGRAEFTLLRRMGFRYIAVGNHELDLGEDHFWNLLNAVGLPDSTTRLLSANLDVASHPLRSAVQPWDTFRVEGKLVGIFGMITPMPTNILPRLGDSVRAQDPVSVAQTVVETLQALGVDAVVMLSHLGLATEREVVRQVAGIHLVIGGHSHTYLPEPVVEMDPAGDTVWIVQVGSFVRWVGVTRLDLSGSRPRLGAYQTLPVEPGTEDPGIRAFLDSLRTVMTGVYGRDPYAITVATVIDTVEGTWDTLQAFQDTPLGNFVADALRDTLRVLDPDLDAALMPLMLISDPLFPGSVTEADVFRASPYGYDPATRLNSRLVVVGMRGSTLRSALLFSLFFYPDMLAQPSGMTYRFARVPAIQILDVQVGGAPVVDTQIYRIGMDVWSLYGITQVMGLAVEFADTLPVTVAHALWRYAEQQGTLHYTREGRVIRQDDVDVVEGARRNSPVRLVASPGRLALRSWREVPFAVRDLLGRRWRAGKTPAVIRLPRGVYIVETPSGTRKVWIP